MDGKATDASVFGRTGRGRSARVGAALIGFAALVSLGAAALAGAADPLSLGAGPTPPPNARELAEQRAPEASSPAEIAASATAYEDASPDDAAQVAEDEFSGFLDPLARAAEPAEDVVHYQGLFSAVVDAPGAEPKLLESTVPLRVQDEGALRPVDLTLAETPNGFEPTRPLVDVALPSELEQGIEVDGGLGIEFSEADGAATATPLAEGSAVLYGDVERDLDLIVAPTDAGVRLLAQVRSADAPEELRIDLSLPDGASLVATEDGGAAVVRGDQKAAITPPLALDADGLPVASKLSVEDHALVLRVEHHGESAHYPVLVDPEVFCWACGDLGGSGFWRSFRTGGTSHLFSFQTASGSQGLWIHTLAGSYPNNSHGYWTYAVPHSAVTQDGPSPNPASTSAYVSKAIFWPVSHSASGPDREWSPFLQFCLDNVVNNSCVTGQSGSQYAYASWHGGSPWYGSITLDNLPNNQQAEQVAVDHPSDNYPNGTLGSGSRRDTYFGGAEITMADGEAPSVTPTHSLLPAGDLPTAWTNSTATARVAVAGTDGGLGVKSARVKAGCKAAGTNCSFAPAAKPVYKPLTTTPCVGTKREGICPQTTDGQLHLNWDYGLNSLPEGLSYGFASVTDVLNKASASSQGRWELRIDRTPPTAQVTGSLKDSAGQPLGLNSYDLSISAQDGSSSSPAAERSGVKSIEILIDSNLAFRQEQDPASSQPMNLDWTMYPTDYAPGQHTAKVVVRDKLDHESQSQFTFEIPPNNGSTVPPVHPEAYCGSTMPPADENAVDELLLAVDPDAVEDLGLSMFGERYAGSWIQRDVCPSTVHAALRDASQSELADFDEALGDDPRIDGARIDTETIGYSHSQLQGEGETAGAILRANAIDPYEVRASLRQQMLTVRARVLPPSVRAAIDAAVGPPVTYEEDPAYGGFDFANATRDTFPPYLAGLGPVTGPDTGACTSGFTIFTGPAHSANYHATTAGHCLPRNWNPDAPPFIEVDGPRGGIIGRLQKNKANENVDIAQIQLDDQVARGRVFTEPHEHRKVVKRFRGSDSFWEGRYICFQGYVSGKNNCGGIQDDWEAEITEGNVTLTNLPCMHEDNDEGAEGDSGGPMYEVFAEGTPNEGAARAAGTVTGFRYEIFGRVETCFTPIGRSLSALDATLSLDVP